MLQSKMYLQSGYGHLFPKVNDKLNGKRLFFYLSRSEGLVCGVLK